MLGGSVKDGVRAAVVLMGMAALAGTAARADTLPASVRGTWRIERVLPTTNSGCWTAKDAQTLVGTTLSYSPTEMRWRGGVVRLDDIFTRTVSGAEFEKENTGPQAPASFAQLGIRAAAVTEVDMQHPDAAVLPASTAIPGDSVMIVSPDRIVVSACGVYFEAVRPGTRFREARALRTHEDDGRATGR